MDSESTSSSEGPRAPIFGANNEFRFRAPDFLKQGFNNVWTSSEPTATVEDVNIRARDRGRQVNARRGAEKRQIMPWFQNIYNYHVHLPPAQAPPSDTAHAFHGYVPQFLYPIQSLNST